MHVKDCPVEGNVVEARCCPSDLKSDSRLIRTDLSHNRVLRELKGEHPCGSPTSQGAKPHVLKPFDLTIQTERTQKRPTERILLSQSDMRLDLFTNSGAQSLERLTRSNLGINRNLNHRGSLWKNALLCPCLKLPAKYVMPWTLCSDSKIGTFNFHFTARQWISAALESGAATTDT
jgi:hypothetical protein